MENIAPPERLRYTLKEAADVLGISLHTAKRRVADGKLTAIKDGRLYVTATELRRYSEGKP